MGTAPSRSDSLDVRRWEPGDLAQVVELVRHARELGPDEDHLAFFAWKHFENPFGPSPGWLAVDGGRAVGVRTFVRWELERAGETVPAVRAVDTSVHPDWQRRGIFSRLTAHALADLGRMGVEMVFNTPNSKSMPGYLKMGWKVVGRPPVAFRPRSITSLVQVARARTAAERWSLPGAGGVPAAEALADHEGVDRLLASQPVDARLRTRRSPAYLAWRYGLDALQYRAVVAGPSVDQGLAVYRLRRRGRATEAAICEAIAPEGDRRATARLAVGAAAASGADHAIVLGHGLGPWSGFFPLPRQGPVLTCRLLSDGEVPSLPEWNLQLGDVELL